MCVNQSLKSGSDVYGDQSSVHVQILLQDIIMTLTVDVVRHSVTVDVREMVITSKQKNSV